VSIKLPPLRDRKEDIPLLANHFLNKISEKYGKNIQGFKPETLTALELYHWPGNVRELENAIERCVILAEQETEYIPPDLLSPEIKAKVVPVKEPSPAGPEDIPSIPDPENIKTKKAAFEKNMLWEALIKNKWNQSTAAKELGIHESTLRYKMEKFNIKKP
jgi:two-component system NtrC family response regulator